MQITAIAPQRITQDRMNVHVDGAFRLSLSSELVLGIPLRVGDEVDEERLAELEARDRGWKARDAALSLLSHRDRSTAELSRRLQRKGYDAVEADATVRRLSEQGLVSDEGFAAAFARDRVRHRPRGARLLTAELRTRGVDPATADEAVAAAMGEEGAGELDLARAAAARWRPRAGEEPARARRRLQAFLERRGFASDAIRTVVAEVLPR